MVKQTKVRIFDGVTQLPGKIVSLFEPHTEIIRKGKASKPTEFGKMMQLLEAENQIVTHYDVFDKRPSDRELFAEAVATHKQILGRAPNLATADAGYYSQVQERAAQEQGVKLVAIPNRSTRSVERKVKEKTRWFKKAQRWRTGCEGRISVLKRRHGLNRCRYRGEDGMKRWVGWVSRRYLDQHGNALREIMKGRRRRRSLRSRRRRVPFLNLRKHATMPAKS